MNVFAGLPSDAMNVNDESLDSTHPFPIRVDIAIENPYHFRGEVIAFSVPLLPLKATVPILLQYLTIDGAQIIIPRSEAIDRNLLLNLIELIIDRYRSGEGLEIDIHELLHDPVRLIKLHVILKLFALDYQAQNLLESLWLVFKTHIMSHTDVFWIWGALYPHRGVRWVPESTEFYLQMMAWNVLNGDAEGVMHPELRTFFLEEEGKPYHLTNFLEQHYLDYGLGCERKITSSSTLNKRRDTAIEHTERATLFCSSPTSPSTSALTKAPIFPDRWLSPPGSKELRNSVSKEALFPYGEWNSKECDYKWDGKDKDVKEMVIEREGLVSLRRKQAFLRTRVPFRYRRRLST